MRVNVLIDSTKAESARPGLEAIQKLGPDVHIRIDSGNPVALVPDTIQMLWDVFGGTIDDAGLKHPLAPLLLSEPLTAEQRDAINAALKAKGFAPIEGDAINAALKAKGFAPIEGAN